MYYNEKKSLKFRLTNTQRKLLKTLFKPKFRLVNKENLNNHTIKPGIYAHENLWNSRFNVTLSNLRFSNSATHSSSIKLATSEGIRVSDFANST
ncbi:jg20984 [Pararge aegeria aegeria]|uniref:Jg20984 protein n=1 Tax=Pararge aegeria aegeria TaxID=348720 RepID=A0A8S4R872_9NEOP|nr:jg20984 [Pararge aegeria aegeria]